LIEVIRLGERAPDLLAGDLEKLAESLRVSDLAEIQATSEMAPLDALRVSVGVSDMAWLVFWKGEPVCVFGVAPTPTPGIGSVWMMGTPGMDRAALAILRRTAPYLRQMHERYPLLWNYIDARNERSMAWLEWAGFRLTEAHPQHGREGRLFFTFARYEPHV
jgi:hypothetical protein